jgi:hypothetical protein
VFDLALTAEHMFDILPTMARTRVRWSRLATAGFAVALAVGTVAGRAGAGAGPGAEPGRRPASLRVHLVRQGETIWSVARQVVGPRGDPRPTVDELIRANHLEDAIIRPGDRLVLSR